MNKGAGVVAFLLLASPVRWTADASEPSPRRGRRAEATVVPPASIVGTITYDTGVNAGFHPDAVGGNLNRIVGNRFNSALGGPLVSPNEVSFVTVFPANDGDQSISIASAPTTMNTAMVLDYLLANDLVAGQFNRIPIVPPVDVGADFLAVFLGVFGSSQPAGLLGMSDMATMGQGYHAVQGFYLSGMVQTMLQAVPNRNAMLRATQPLWPVELLRFEIE
jgi:hypothetical protein